MRKRNVPIIFRLNRKEAEALDKRVKRSGLNSLIEAGVENPIDIENIRLALQQYNAEVEEYDSLVLQHYIFERNLIESHI